MADVFSPTWVYALGNLRPSGATQLLVKIGTDAAFYSLGTPADVKLDGKSLFKNDALLRNLGWGFRREFTVPSLQASAVELKILDELLTQTLVGFQIQMADGIYLNDITGLFGLRWKVMSSGDFDNFRRIEYLIAGNAKPSEMAGVFTNTGVTIGTPGADALATLQQVPIPANQVPNGLTKIEFKASGDAAYANLGDFNKAIWTFECVGPLGGGARGFPRTHTIKFNLDVHGLQTGLVEIGLLGAIETNLIDLKLTHADGMIITLNHTNFSLLPNFLADGNVDKDRSIDFKAEGSFTPKNDGTQYQTTGGTAWDSIFS